MRWGCSPTREVRGATQEARQTPKRTSRLAPPASDVVHVLVHLMPPVRPVVSAHRAPVVEVMTDAAAGENPREAIGLARFFPRTGAGRDVDVAAGEVVQRPAVGQ